MHDNPRSGLIGHSGFVGSALKKQHSFDALYRSTDIDSIANQEFDLLVCAGAPAQKWLANQQPEQDLQTIHKLIRALANVRCKHFVLISTVDVFSSPVGVDESSFIQTDGLHPYGLHRRELELFVQQTFSSTLILRLPGLVGPGLRKNVIFDIHNHHDIGKIDSRSVFQFYPTVNLWTDIQKAMQLGLDLVHCTAEPLSVSEVSHSAFNQPFDNHVSEQPPIYDFQTLHAVAMGGLGRYTYTKKESMLAIRAYAQSEPLSRPIA